MSERCSSVDVIVLTGNKVKRIPCGLLENHKGRCHNALAKHSWVRLGEVWRERGLVGFSEGGRVRPGVDKGSKPASRSEASGGRW